MTEGPEASRRPPPAIQTGRAFGVDLAAGFAFPGLGPVPALGALRPTRLDLTTQRALTEGWPSDAAVLVDKRRSDGRSLYRLESDPRHGLLISAVGWGRYLVGGAGDTVRCAPVRDAAWRWQRFLVGQVLPMLALVRGHEVFHAGAVALAGDVVALAGPSGSGKSSIAFALLGAGCDFVADDVLAVEADQGGDVVVHPGPGLLSLRPDPAGRALDLGGRGRLLGHDGEAARVVVPVDTGPRRLRAFVVLERRADAGRPRLSRMRPVDPRVLLGATFQLVLQTPQRLVRQLDVCARIAAGVDVYRLRIGVAVTANEAAAVVVNGLAAR